MGINLRSTLVLSGTDHRIKEQKGKAYLSQETISYMKTTPQNINQTIADQFQRMSAIYSAEQSPFKASAYRRAADTIRHHETPLTSGKEAMKLRGVGKSLARHIDEIIQTGHLPKLQSRQTTTGALQELCTVSGIGPVTASKLTKQHGVISLDDLRDKVKRALVKLNAQQLIGLKYHDELQKEIPRSEMEVLKSLIWETAQGDLYWTQETMNMEVCGSYRRGKASSGDIDILLAQNEPNPKSNDAMVLHELIGALKKRNIVTDVLGLGTNKFAGIVKVPSTITTLAEHSHLHRRIDIRIVNKDAFPAALLYYTGSGVFNNDMRKFAKEKGYKLTEYGLFNRRGKLIPVTNERQIFEQLRLPYVEPPERETFEHQPTKQPASETVAGQQQVKQSFA